MRSGSSRRRAARQSSRLIAAIERVIELRELYDAGNRPAQHHGLQHEPGRLDGGRRADRSIEATDACSTRHRASHRRRQCGAVVADHRQPWQRGKRHHRRRRQPAAQRTHPQPPAVRAGARQPLSPVSRRADGVLQLARTERRRPARSRCRLERLRELRAGLRGTAELHQPRRRARVSPHPAWRASPRCCGSAFPLLRPGRFGTRSSRPPIRRPQRRLDGARPGPRVRERGRGRGHDRRGNRARPSGARQLQPVGQGQHRAEHGPQRARRIGDRDSDGSSPASASTCCIASIRTRGRS